MSQPIPTCFVLYTDDYDHAYKGCFKTMENLTDALKDVASSIGEMRITYKYDRNRPVKARIEILDLHWYKDIAVGEFEAYNVDIVYLD